MNIFEEIESNVRSYCRTFTTVFQRAKGCKLEDENGKEYIDFFAGAGTLNYGHNPDELKKELIEYISDEGITHSLDLHTASKRKFLTRFRDVILRPRDLDYKVMFPGPTGTNAVEAALKLARKVTGRQNIVSFTNAFHGMTLGALAVTGNASKRKGAGTSLHNTVALPYDGNMPENGDAIEFLRSYLENSSSGLDKPAAFIVETLQGEGGINVARKSWLKDLAALAKEHEVLLIVDDIQMGCGRTGPFFSFEGMGFKPDIVTLSKSLSGYGLPFALTLFKPELDIWEPGEHNGTFRGHNLAFVTAAKALDFWQDKHLEDHVLKLGQYTRIRLNRILDALEIQAEVRGRGLINGIEFEDPSLANELSSRCYKEGLIMETSGSCDQVIKFMPPINIDQKTLDDGLGIFEQCLTRLLDSSTEQAEVTVGASA